MSIGADPAALFRSWQERREGFAPLFLEPVMRAALEGLAPALRTGAWVLDAGSGGGHLARVFREHGARTLELDLDLPLLEASRTRHPGGQPLTADLVRLPLRDASVDAVFASSVFQYVERAAALAEIRRVLRPGGRLTAIENLAHHPLIQAYRVQRALRGPVPLARLRIRRHLAWRECAVYRQMFPDAQWQPFELASPALLVWPRIRHADAHEPAHSWARRLTAGVQRWDQQSLRSLPALGHLAWMTVIRATR